MATTVSFNGSNYSIPAYGDTGWAQGPGNLSSYLIAISSGTLQTTGGTFTLTAPIDFGTIYGLLAASISTHREIYIAGTPLNNYTGSLTVFDLVTAYPANARCLNVYVNGLLQDITYDYAETSTTRITFNGALTTGDRVSLRWG